MILPIGGVRDRRDAPSRDAKNTSAAQADALKDDSRRTRSKIRAAASEYISRRVLMKIDCFDKDNDTVGACTGAAPRKQTEKRASMIGIANVTDALVP